NLARYRIELGNFVRARIPDKAILIEREVSEAGRIQRNVAFDADLLHIAGFRIQTVELVRPVFRDPGDAVLVDLLMMRSGHDTGCQRKRVFGEDSRFRIHLSDVTGLVAGEPYVALPIERRIVESEQLLRQFKFSDDDSRGFATRTRKDAQRRIL